MNEKFPVAIAASNGTVVPADDAQTQLDTRLAHSLFDLRVQPGIAHDAALADLPWLQFELRLDQHQQVASRCEKWH